MVWRTTTTNAITWVASALLAAVFLIAGVPKILYDDVFWVQAFSMWGYPGWIRTLVGIVEVVGGVLLLVPAMAAYASLVLALLMAGATYTQLASNQGGWLVPALMFVALLAIAWVRRPEDLLRETQELEIGASHLLHDRITREGFISGMLGATSVAVWFLIVDTIQGEPLFTPLVLGRALFSVLGPAPVDGTSRLLDNPALIIAGYTMFHYAAFFAVGLIAATVVHIAEKEPHILAGFVVLFVIFEIGFHAMVALLQETTVLGALAWYQVMLGNLLAAVLMGGYLWRAHPELREELQHALDGTA